MSTLDLDVEFFYVYLTSPHKLRAKVFYWNRSMKLPENQLVTASADSVEIDLRDVWKWKRVK